MKRRIGRFFRLRAAYTLSGWRYRIYNYLADALDPVAAAIKPQEGKE